MTTTTKTIYYRGLCVEGMIVSGEWEGDSSVPGGINRLPDYVSDIEICSPDGDDITDMLTDDAIEECEDALLESVEVE